MHPLSQKIASLRRRLVLWQRALAACRIISTVFAAALVLGGIDYWLRVADPGLRIMATLALAAAAAWAGYRWWYVPSRRRLQPLHVARRVEAHFPELDDSLASAVEFLEQSEDNRAAGSAQLRRHVVATAQTAVEGLPLERIIDRRPLRRAAAVLGAIGLVFAGCLALDARAVGTALMRLVAPLGSAEWPRQHHLAFRDAPTRLAVGQTFEVELIDMAGPLPQEVHIEYRVATGGRRELSSEPMMRSGDIMLARRENVRESFSFRATGGDDRHMPWHEVTVVAPPQLKSLTIEVHPPAYTGLPAKPAERRLEVLAGTGIEVSGTAGQPLGGARILLNGNKLIRAEIGPDSSGRQRRAFHIRPERWVAAASGPYSVELSGADGIAGVVGKWNVRVEPDAPPTVLWRRPRDDLYVTTAAVVPMELLVTDNLAVRRVELLYERSDQTTSDPTSEPTPQRIELYRGPVEPTPITQDAPRRRGENRMVEFSWDLAPLQLPVGAQLTLYGEAADYRPGVGRTVAPRRITVITTEDLEARLADRQTQIVRQLERALAAQRSTREDVRRLEIQQRDAGGLTSSDRNALQTAELNQRGVRRTLVDPAEGIPALVEALLSEMEVNRLPISELGASMERLVSELERLSSDSLAVAERELVATRKSVDGAQNDEAADNALLSIVAAQARRLQDSLTAAGIAQDDVIITLERLISEFSDRADYRRLAQQLAELRQDQLAHQHAARTDIGLETLPLQLSELSRAQRASLNKASAGQTAIAARFEQILQAMQEMSQELAEKEAGAAATLADAANLAESRGIGTAMRAVAQDFSENRIGQALSQETQVAADMEQMLDILRNEREHQPGELVDRLRDAEQRLAELRQRLADVRQQVAQAERPSTTPSDPQQLAQLHEQQEALQREIEQMSRQLDRLQAPDASRSTQNAANRLANQPPSGNQNSPQSPRPSPSSAAEKAEQDLEQAARELAQRRQQAEQELALEFIRRFQAELGQMVERQKRVIDDTAELDALRPTNEELDPAAVQTIKKLVGEEQQLAEMAHEHSELLAGLGAVRISLEEAERRLTAAAKLLADHRTGPAAQQAERRALERLEGMLEAFAQTANEASQNQPPPAGTGAPAGQPPQRRPTFELLEVKMLRMLQIDLNERTRSYEQRIAGLEGQPNDRQRAELTREGRELQAEQARLAELVQQMLVRNNEPQQ
jgi:hypothetical protein